MVRFFMMDLRSYAFSQPPATHTCASFRRSGNCCHHYAVEGLGVNWVRS
jgi:hypothetical protein